MKKLIPMLLLVGVSTNVFTEWVWAWSADNFNSYVDFATIRKKGNKVKMWNLIDFKTAQTVTEFRHLSQKTQTEYDCQEEQLRTVAFSWFSGNMGRGKAVYANSDTQQWSPVEPESINEKLFKIACGIK
jgi:hypothetical protein